MFSSATLASCTAGPSESTRAPGSGLNSALLVRVSALLSRCLLSIDAGRRARRGSAVVRKLPHVSQAHEHHSMHWVPILTRLCSKYLPNKVTTQGRRCIRAVPIMGGGGAFENFTWSWPSLFNIQLVLQEY